VSLLRRARARVQDLGGGEGDPFSVAEDVDTCRRCQVGFVDTDDGGGLCIECEQAIDADEAYAHGYQHRAGF